MFATNNRAQMETYLTLHGWVPAYVGVGGAVRDGQECVYVSRWPNGELRLAAQREPHVWAQGFADTWYMSDEIFWRLARYIAIHNADSIGETS